MDRQTLNQQFLHRQKRTRAKLSGTSARPRLSVFRSSKTIYAQIIDDEKKVTLCSVSARQLAKEKVALKGDKKAQSFALGESLAKKASQKGIKKVVFDRGGFRYWGRVQALAEGARKGGLDF